MTREEQGMEIRTGVLFGVGGRRIEEVIAAQSTPRMHDQKSMAAGESKSGKKETQSWTD